MTAGYGCALMRHPERAAGLVTQTRNALADTNFTVSVKMRVFEDTKWVSGMFLGMQKLFG